MDKEDFLEILRDYLRGAFSELETNNILREYREIFIKNELNDISDEDTIYKLGSPKRISEIEIDKRLGKQKVIEEAKNQGSGGKLTALFVNLRKRIRNRTKNKKKRKKSHLSEEYIVSGRTSEKTVQTTLKATMIFMIIIAVPIVLVISMAGVFLLGFSVANIISIMGTFFLFSYNVWLGLFMMFVSITWIGVSILLWVIFTFALKWVKDMAVKYISWHREKRMFLRVRHDHISLDGSELEYGGDDSED